MGNFPGVWILCADVSEHPYTYLPIKMEKNVPKRWHIKFRRRGITQKKTYNIQNTAKIWNQENYQFSSKFEIQGLRKL